MANKVIMIGNITRDPTFEYINERGLCKFGIAHNEKWKGKDGTQREKVCFVDWVAWGKTGEFVNQYFQKGKQIYIEAKLSMETWTAQDGSNRSKLYLTIEHVEFVGPPPQQQQPGGQRQPQNNQSNFDDDIPF